MIVPFKPKNCPNCQGHVLIGLVSNDDYFMMKCPHCEVALFCDQGTFSVVDGGQTLTKTKGKL